MYSKYLTLYLQKLAKAVDAKSKIDVCSGGGSEVALMVVSDPEKTGVRFRLDREKTLKDVRKEIGDEKYSKNKGTAQPACIYRPVSGIKWASRHIGPMTARQGPK